MLLNMLDLMCGSELNIKYVRINLKSLELDAILKPKHDKFKNDISLKFIKDV